MSELACVRCVIEALQESPPSEALMRRARSNLLVIHEGETLCVLHLRASGAVS